MPYTQSCEHDIFISFAHTDNWADRDGDKGWVDDFAEQLYVRLQKRAGGTAVEVWRDRRLKRVELFDQVIESAVQNAAVMILLITPTYLDSTYCRQEIEWFRKKAEQDQFGLSVDGALRLFPVLLYNIPYPKWPDACQGTSAFPFYTGSELDAPLDPGSDAFSDQLQRLVQELHDVLTQLQVQEAETRSTQPESSEDVVAEPKFTVFIGCPADDLRPVQRQLSTALGREGIAVIDGIPPPHDEAEHAARAVEVLQQADLSVHLLGTRPGEPIGLDNPSKTYALEQVRLGLDHAKSQLILTPDEFHLKDIEDPVYAELMRELSEQPREANRLELIRLGPSRMLDEILAKRDRLAPPALPGQTAFIDLHTNDVSCATELVVHLSQRQITPVMIPSGDASPADSMTQFADTLKKSAWFIVVYGTVARDWVNNRLNEAFKLILYHSLPTKIGVYVAPPAKPPDAIQFPPFFHVMPNSEGFNERTLNGLLP